MAEFRKAGGFRSGARDGGRFRSSGDRSSFARKGGFGGGRGRDDSRSEMFTATCAECSKRCEVPFRPSGARPVYCKECFGGNREVTRHDGGHREASRNFETRVTPPVQSSFVDKRIDELNHQVEALHKKIDAVTVLLENLKPVKASEASKPIKAEKKVVQKTPAKATKKVAKAAKKQTKK